MKNWKFIGIVLIICIVFYCLVVEYCVPDQCCDKSAPGQPHAVTVEDGHE